MQKLFTLLCFLLISFGVQSQCYTVTVNSCNDYDDYLHIKGDSLWWQTFGGSPPGTHSDCGGSPVTVNGVAWSPWNSVYIMPFSTANCTFTATVLQCSDICDIIQAPTPANGFEGIYEFNDEAPGGAHWFTIQFAFFCPYISSSPDTTICPGTSANLWASGGVSYSWSPSSSLSCTSCPNPVATPGATTPYTVTVTDPNNCTAMKTVTVTVEQPLAITNYTSEVTCFGLNTGSAYITYSGGIPPATYLWNNGITTIADDSVFAGTYSVTLTDAIGCTASSSMTVNQPNVLTASETHTDVTCNAASDGTITLTIAGGTTPYTFAWNDGNTNQNRTGLGPGNYSVVVTDSNGCTATAAAVIAEPPPLTLSQTHTDVNCNAGTDGTITINPGGGTTPYAYLWNDGNTNQNRTALVAGNYSVTLTDAHSCTISVSAAIAEPTALTISEQHVDEICFGQSIGSITITVGGGTPAYTYLWNDGNTNANRTALPAGAYQVTATDAHTCNISISVTISQPPVLAISETHTDVSCSGLSDGAINITVGSGTAPFTYAWSDGNTNQNRTALAAGNYVVSVTDNNTCSSSLSIDIAQPALLVLSETHSDVKCKGGSDGTISLTQAGGTSPYSYSWNDGNTNQNRTGLIVGNYAVTITDAHTCTDTLSVDILEPAVLTVAETHVNELCFNGNNASITIITGGGTTPYTFAWNDGNASQNRTSINAGNYSLTVTDANLCTVSVSATIAQPTALTATETHINDSCAGFSDGSINVTTSGGLTPYTYGWNDGNTNQNRISLAAGNYTVTITDSNFCTLTLSVNITEPTILSVSASPTNISCYGGNDGQITTTTTGGTTPYSYLWNDGVTTQNRTTLQAGNYILTVTDNLLCTASANVTLTQPDSLSFNPVINNPLCPLADNNGSIVTGVAGGTPPYSYLWSNNVTTADIFQLTTGNYIVTVTDANSCTNSSAYLLDYLFNFTIAANPAVSIKLGETIELGYTLTGYAGNYVNIWSPSSSLSCADCANPIASPVRTTTYNIIVQNDSGCVVKDTITVTVIPDYGIFVPNVFTPNNDGNNDVFKIYSANTKNLQYMEIQIFNRIGEKVFESNDINFEWDGTYKGVLQPTAVYVWQLKMVFIDDHTENLRKGALNLLR